jgi:hypothetical protein
VYVGALAAPKASLGARLELYSDIRDIFLDLLVTIEDNVSQGSSIIVVPFLMILNNLVCVLNVLADLR